MTHCIRLALANRAGASLPKFSQIDIVFNAITPGERELVTNDNIL